MAVLAAGVPTLLDLNSQTNPDGTQATPIEMLNQANELIPDVYWELGNLPTGHRTTVRTSLPTVTSRQLNAGVTPGKSTTDQFTDSCAILEAYSVIDKVLVESAPNPAGYRMNERAAFMEAFGQKFTNLFFYGNSITTPSDFTGLSPRYNDLDGLTGPSMIDAGGSSTDNFSMWLIGHGPRAVAGIYMKGGQAGLVVEDKGEKMWQTSTTLGASTSALRAYIEWYEWTCGLSVRDWRYAIRIANISKADAVGLTGDQELTDYSTFLLNMMVLAFHKLPKNTSGVRLAYYCNRTIAYALHIMALNKASSQLTVETVAGKPVTMFLGIPVRTVDQLTTEATPVTTGTVSI